MKNNELLSKLNTLDLDAKELKQLSKIPQTELNTFLGSNLETILSNTEYKLPSNKKNVLFFIIPKIPETVLTPYLSQWKFWKSISKLEDTFFTLILQKIESGNIQDWAFTSITYSSETQILINYIFQTKNFATITTYLGYLNPFKLAEGIKKNEKNLGDKIQENTQLLIRERSQLISILKVAALLNNWLQTGIDPELFLLFFSNINIHGHFNEWLRILKEISDSLKQTKKTATVIQLNQRTSTLISQCINKSIAKSLLESPHCALTEFKSYNFQEINIKELAGELSLPSNTHLGQLLFKPIAVKAEIDINGDFNNIEYWIKGMFLLHWAANNGDSDAVNELFLRCNNVRDQLSQNQEEKNVLEVNKTLQEEIKDLDLDNRLQQYFEIFKNKIMSTNSIVPNIFRSNSEILPESIYKALGNIPIDKFSLLKEINQIIDSGTLEILTTSIAASLVNLKKIILLQDLLTTMKQAPSASLQTDVVPAPTPTSPDIIKPLDKDDDSGVEEFKSRPAPQSLSGESDAIKKLRLEMQLEIKALHEKIARLQAEVDTLKSQKTTTQPIRPSQQPNLFRSNSAPNLPNVPSTERKLTN